MKKLIALSLFLVLTLGACTGAPSDTSTENTTTNSKPMTQEVNQEQTRAPEAGDTVVTINTNKGEIKARIFVEEGGEIAKNFVELAKSGYYDGVIFHRVIPDFMVQGGDPEGTGRGGHSYKGEGTYIEDEFIDWASNIRGSLSMANAGPNTNGSQFFINQADNSYLDFDKEPLSSKHSVFGQVYEGMEIVDLIASVQRGPGDKPVEDVVMEKVTVSTY